MLADLLRLLSGSTAAFMALLMLRAGLLKVRDLARFEGVLTDYDLANGPVVKVLRLAVPTLELAAAATLCLATTQAIGAALAGGLLLVYAAAMAAALARGRSEIDCGCGGPPSPIGWSLVARNAILAAALVPAARGQAGWRGLDEAAAGWAIAAIALACWIAVEHLSAHHHRMRRDQALLRDGLFGGPA